MWNTGENRQGLIAVFWPSRVAVYLLLEFVLRSKELKTESVKYPSDCNEFKTDCRRCGIRWTLLSQPLLFWERPGFVAWIEQDNHLLTHLTWTPLEVWVYFAPPDYPTSDSIQTRFNIFNHFHQHLFPLKIDIRHCHNQFYNFYVEWYVLVSDFATSNSSWECLYALGFIHSHGSHQNGEGQQRQTSQFCNITFSIPTSNWHWTATEKCLW